MLLSKPNAFRKFEQRVVSKIKKLQVELLLESSAAAFLCEYLSDAITQSLDRAVLVNGMNAYSRLCMLPANKDWIERTADKVVPRAVDLLSLQDTQVVFAVLEILHVNTFDQFEL